MRQARSITNPLPVSARRDGIARLCAHPETIAVAALAVAVILGVPAILSGAWILPGNDASQLRSELAQCLAVHDGVARLACYDEIARRPPPQPAKGANAPRDTLHGAD